LVFTVILVFANSFLAALTLYFLSSSSSIESRDYFFSLIPRPYPEFIDDFLEELFDPPGEFYENDPLLFTEGSGMIDLVFPVIRDFFIFMAKSSGTSSSLRFLCK